MLSKAHFVKIINDIYNSYEFSKTIDKAVHDYNRDFISGFAFSDSQIEADLISLLADVMDDTEDWISWWIYDADFGNSSIAYYYQDGVKHDMKTPEALYDVLVENVEA